MTDHLIPNHPRHRNHTDKATSVVIEGNFKPAKGFRFLRLATVVLLGLLLLSLIGVWGTTALLVYLESQVGQLSQQTRQLAEDSKNLQVRLQKLQSFQAVARSAVAVPHLQPAATNRIELNLHHYPDITWPAFHQRPTHSLPPQGY